MAPLFIGSWVLLIALDIASNWLAGLLPWPSLTIDAGPATAATSQDALAAVPQYFAVRAVYLMAMVVILAPVAVAVHRFILLGEVRKTPFFVTPLTLRFAAWMAVFEIVWALLGQTGDMMAGVAASVPESRIMAYAFLYWLVLAASLILMPVFVLWTLLLFPSVAVEEENSAGAWARLTTAMTRTKGKFWPTLAATVLVLLPVFLLWNAATLAPHYVFGMDQDSKAAPAIAWLLLAGESAASILSVALAAAAASWLYSYAARVPVAAGDTH